MPIEYQDDTTSSFYFSFDRHSFPSALTTASTIFNQREQKFGRLVEERNNGNVYVYRKLLT